MLKITPTKEEKSLRVRLCGQLTKEYLAELEQALGDRGSECQNISLDLSNVTFVDRESMVFLCSARSKNISIENCPSYVIRWIKQERLCGSYSDEPQT